MPASRAGTEMVIKISGDPAELQRLWKSLEQDATKAGVKIGQEMSKGAKQGGSTMWDFVKGQVVFELARKGINELMKLSEAWDKLEINSAQAALSMGEDMKLVSDHARMMAENSVFAADEFAKSMGMLAKQGQETSQILATTDDAAELATATQSNLSDAFMATAKVIEMYGIEAGRTSDVMDILAKGTVKGVYDSLNDLSGVLTTIAPMVQETGGSFQDAVGIALGFGKALRDAGQAGASASMTMLNLTEIMQSGHDTLKRYGIETRKSSGEVKTFAELLDEMAKKGMTGSDMIEMFSKRGAKGMIAMLEAAKEGRNLIAEGTEEALSATGAAADYAATMLESSAVRGAQLKNVFTEMAFVIKENVTEPIEDLVIEFGVDFVKAVNQGARTFVDKVTEMKSVFMGNLYTAVVEWWEYWKNGAEYAWESMQILFTKIESKMWELHAAALGIIRSIAESFESAPIIGRNYTAIADAARSAEQFSISISEHWKQKLAGHYKKRQEAGEEMDKHKATAMAATGKVGEIIMTATKAGVEAGVQTFKTEYARKGVKTAEREGVGTDVAMGAPPPKSRADLYLDQLAEATKENTKAQKEQAKTLKDEVAKEKQRQMMSGKERSEADRQARKEKTAERRAEWVVTKRHEKEAQAEDKRYKEQREEKIYRESEMSRTYEQEKKKGKTDAEAEAIARKQWEDKDKDKQYQETKKSRHIRQMQELKKEPGYEGKSDRELAAEVVRRDKEKEGKGGRTAEEQKGWDELRKQTAEKWSGKEPEGKKGDEDKKTDEQKKRSKALEKSAKAQKEAEKKQDDAIQQQQELYKKMGENWTKEEQNVTAVVKVLDTHGKRIDELKRQLDNMQRAVA